MSPRAIWKDLARQHGIIDLIQDGKYSDDGTWYHNLQGFPGALLDKNGYIIFPTEASYVNCPNLQIEQDLNVTNNGICDIEGYRLYDQPNQSESIIITNEDEESRFPEGKEKYRYHKSLERDPMIGKKAKEVRLEKVGELRCDACDFSFADTYGGIGAGFIEAHHSIPVSELKGQRKTKVDEIDLVCANCHRMLHAGDKLLSLEDLKKLLMKEDRNT